MKGIAGALGRALRTLGLDGGVARAGALDAWPAVAAKLLGAEAVRCRAIRVDGDTLVLVVPSSAHAAEIRLHERDLIRALAVAAPESGVLRVRCAPAGDGGMP